MSICRETFSFSINRSIGAMVKVMKSLFNVIAAGIRIQSRMLTVGIAEIKKEGNILPGFIQEIREEFEASELPSALQQYVGALATMSHIPTWVGELNQEIALLKASWQKTEASMMETVEAVESITREAKQ